MLTFTRVHIHHPIIYFVFNRNLVICISFTYLIRKATELPTFLVCEMKCETGASTGTPSEIEILIAENSQQLAILAMKQFDSDGCLQGATTN